MKSGREWALRAALLSGASLFSLLAVEGIIRLSGVGRLHTPLQPHPIFHHWMPGSYEAVEWNYEEGLGRFPVRHNRLGFPMSDELPGPQEPCVVFLGDSFTVAREVPESLRFVSRAGQTLGVRTLNFGCPSFCPILSRLQLEQYAGQLNIQAVVLLLCANDIPGDAEMSPLAVRDGSGRVVAVPGRKGRGWLAPIRRSHAGRLLRQGWRALRFYVETEMRWDGAWRASAWSPYFSRPVPEWYDSSDLEFTERNVLDIAQICRQRGSRFFLSAVPDRGALALGGRDYFARFVEELAVEHGINYIDLVVAFRNHPAEELYFARDPHFTSKAHSLVADAIAAAIRDAGWADHEPVKHLMMIDRNE